MAIGAIIGGVAQIAGGIIGGAKARKAARRARKKLKQMNAKMAQLEANRQEIINPYEGAENLSDMMSNPMANLGVATQATEMQIEQTDQALANTLDTLRETGGGAGSATALAQAALQSKQNVAAGIEQQEKANEDKRAAGEQRLQDAKIAEEKRMQNLDAAGILGVEENDLRQTFKERQLGSDAFRKLEQGIFDPYFPSKDIQDRFREIADNLGDLDMFQEVAPTLREMETDFREIELGDTFNLNLGDYLEDTGSIAESLGIGNIGQTPPPNQGVIQTSQLQGSGNITSQGLTPTELALLSPEEQQIRLRQRGLA